MPSTGRPGSRAGGAQPMGGWCSRFTEVSIDMYDVTEVHREEHGIDEPSGFEWDMSMVGIKESWQWVVGGMEYCHTRNFIRLILCHQCRNYPSDTHI